MPDGPLTSELQKIVPGDTVLMRQKSTGTLVLDALTPAKRLFMISTGTGIAPFASLIRDPETYEKFEQIVLTHTCRDHAELAYGVELFAQARRRPADRRADGRPPHALFARRRARSRRAWAASRG